MTRDGEEDIGIEAAPDWLLDWRRHGLTSEAALAIFDGLPPLEPSELVGRWRGTGLHANHPLDGLLERYGWYGKAFRSAEDVDPLLFRFRRGDITAIDPGRLPVSLALRLPRLARTPLGPALFRILRPFLQTRRSAARLKSIAHRGRESAAMIYDAQAMVDHFRRIDADRVLGMMRLRGSRQPFFFLLEKEAAHAADRADQ